MDENTITKPMFPSPPAVTSGKVKSTVFEVEFVAELEEVDEPFPGFANTTGKVKNKLKYKHLLTRDAFIINSIFYKIA